MNDLLNIMRALADPTRLRIVFLVLRLELSIGELVQILAQSQPRVSRHVRILDEVGLLERRKEGSWVFMRPGPVLKDGRLDPLLSGPDLAQTRFFQRDLARLEEVREGRAAMAAHYFATHAEEWDSLRSLHVAECEVEQAMQEMLGDAPLGTLLDVGTGTGRMIELFASVADRFVALDNSPEMLRLARAKVGRLDAPLAARIDIVQGDFNALPLADGQFDTVVFHQVLHYAQDPDKVIGEAARVLASEGRLAIVDFAAHDHEELRSQHAHARLGFDDSAIEQMFRTCGLIPVKTTTLDGGALTVKIWLARKLGEGAALPQRMKSNLRMAS
jgi:ubiquinone/menaquinone biosynthesis C-methylase UbiE